MSKEVVITEKNIVTCNGDDIKGSNHPKVWLKIKDTEKFVDCPYFVDKKRIVVTMEKMALQLMLFAGDITKYGLARAMSKADEKKSQ